MVAQQRFYDVYVSYPPGEDPERVNECIRDNLSAEEADDIIHALSEQRQAIIAEHCTNEERENAQHYFTYLGLDVIVRLSLEFADSDKHAHSQNRDELSDPIPQCPVCYTILENPAIRECPTCSLNLEHASEEQIHRKRIEWQERIAFEHRKKHEIAYKLLREKQEEEKRLRKQIRNELEAQLMVEMGRYHGWRKFLHGRNAGLIIVMALLIMALLTIIYLLMTPQKTNNEQTTQTPQPRAAQPTHPAPATTPEQAPTPNNNATPSSSNNNEMAAEPSQTSQPKPVQHTDLPDVSVPSMVSEGSASQ